MRVRRRREEGSVVVAGVSHRSDRLGKKDIPSFHTRQIQIATAPYADVCRVNNSFFDKFIH